MATTWFFCQLEESPSYVTFVQNLSALLQDFSFILSPVCKVLNSPAKLLPISIGAHNVAELIECDIEDLKLALSTRNMKVGNDNIVQKLTLSQVSKFLKQTFHILNMDDVISLFGCSRRLIQGMHWQSLCMLVCSIGWWSKSTSHWEWESDVQEDPSAY